jgi:hypothetical protein
VVQRCSQKINAHSVINGYSCILAETRGCRTFALGRNCNVRLFLGGGVFFFQPTDALPYFVGFLDFVFACNAFLYAMQAMIQFAMKK